MAHVDLYDDTAEIYDIVELAGKTETPITNHLIIDALQSVDAHFVLDMTCGTGAQTLALSKAGFDVTGSDLSEGMLKVAMRKSKELKIPYYQADMRSVSLGQFDGILSMYNAVGHLSRKGFVQTIRNAADNLRDGGIYIFDIFNRNLMQTVTPNYELIDSVAEIDDRKFVRFTSSEFDTETGIITFDQKTYVQQGLMKPRIIKDHYSLQTYEPKELETMLLENGFDEVNVSGDGMLDLSKISGLVNFVIARKAEVYSI